MRLVVSSCAAESPSLKNMIGVAGWLVAFVCLVIVSLGTAGAQTPEPKITGPANTNDAPPAPSPATARTTTEAAEAVKDALPAKDQPAAMVDPKVYEIGPEDMLRIHVWREPELSAQVQVRPDGRITLPLIGELHAAGLTPEGLKAKVIEALEQFMNKPEVGVSVLQVLSRKYFISGEVNRPGPYPLVVPLTLLEALTNAGGFKEFANRKKISILRKDGKVLKFNYNDAVRGKNMDQNVPVENGDYIFVPD